MSRTLRSTTAATAAAVTAIFALAMAAGVAPATASDSHDDDHDRDRDRDRAYVTVATGLNNPRQLSIGSSHRLYVAEAGTIDPNMCAAIPGAAAEFQVCGFTGSVTEVRRDGQQRRVVTGLPTLDFNGEVIGASDVDVNGNRISVLIGGMAAASSFRGAGPAEYAAFGTLRTGRLQSMPIDGADLELAVDVLAHEVDANPDLNVPPDSNATGFTRLGSKRWAIVDAGGNTLLKADRDGVQTLAVFPNGAPVPNPFGPGEVPPQAVPTDVAVGPDGAFYVSQLTGFPFPTGGSTIWRVNKDGDVTPYATGLTMVTSLEWRGDRLYAVQLDDSNFFDGHVGSLRRITPGGSVHEAVLSGLDAPYGLAIRGHDAYVTVGSVSSGGGSVIQVDLR
ncbi:ScyD/ScyE family protein [Agrococcus beijingensis]|uniref:ScyD/ScyE family protein n=1 Tax=Agrococcus beijingensis TaxID=3068634 RepID=UPI002741DC68|nr:ScyD/ScyE family protein [Agrococcus sp. REN33]